MSQLFSIKLHYLYGLCMSSFEVGGMFYIKVHRAYQVGLNRSRHNRHLFAPSRAKEYCKMTLLWRHNEWALWSLQSPASRLFTQPFGQAQIKENIKAPPHWPLWGDFTGGRWIPHIKGQWHGTCIHMMTSSWIFTHYRESMSMDHFKMQSYFQQKGCQSGK